jgi:hypothetical protein
MEEVIRIYLNRGWNVEVNNQDQVVFSEPRYLGLGFFSINGVNEEIRTFLWRLKNKLIK